MYLSVKHAVDARNRQHDDVQRFTPFRKTPGYFVSRNLQELWLAARIMRKIRLSLSSERLITVGDRSPRLVALK